MVRIGFEVRLHVLTVDGDEVSVVVTRTHARSFGLEEGSTVWLTPAAGATVIPRMAVGGLIRSRGPTRPRPRAAYG